MKYIEHLDEEVGFYASYGSFMHKIIEMYYKGELNIEDMKIKFLFDFENNVVGSKPSETIVSKYIKQGLEYLSSFKPFPFNNVGIEEKIDFRIENNRFVCYIDFIGERNGDLYIIDHKSRDLKPRSLKNNKSNLELDDVLVQLYIYSQAVKEKYGRYPKGLCINCFRTNTFIEEPFRMDKFEEALEWAKNGIRQIKQADESTFHPYIDYFKCNSICGLRDECCYCQSAR